MRTIDWAAVGFGVLLACIGVNLVVQNMRTADRFAACEVRGDIMRKIDGEWQCVKEGGKHGGQ